MATLRDGIPITVAVFLLGKNLLTEDVPPLWGHMPSIVHE